MEAKILAHNHIIKLYYGYHLKSAKIGISCNKGKSTKNPAGIFFYVTTYLHVFKQQVNIISELTTHSN